MLVVHGKKEYGRGTSEQQGTLVLYYPVDVACVYEDCEYLNKLLSIGKMQSRIRYWKLSTGSFGDTD